jgi:hypothetical protein
MGDPIDGPDDDRLTYGRKLAVYHVSPRPLSHPSSPPPLFFLFPFYR